VRWGGGDQAAIRKHAAELVALAPDVLVAGGGAAAELMLKVTHCVCRKRRPFDLVEESRSVGQDGRAALLPFEAIGFAVQADRPA